MIRLNVPKYRGQQIISSLYWSTTNDVSSATITSTLYRNITETGAGTCLHSRWDYQTCVWVTQHNIDWKCLDVTVQWWTIHGMYQFTSRMCPGVCLLCHGTDGIHTSIVRVGNFWTSRDLSCIATVIIIIILIIIRVDEIIIICKRQQWIYRIGWMTCSLYGDGWGTARFAILCVSMCAFGIVDVRFSLLHFPHSWFVYCCSHWQIIKILWLLSMVSSMN